MILLQLKQTLKGIRATKLYSIINVVGLALGLTCTIFISKYILSEYSVNRSLKNSDSIYFSAIKESPFGNYKLLGAKLLTRKIDYQDYPHVLSSTSIQYGNVEITADKKTFPSKILVTDNNFQKVISLTLKIGTFDELFKNPLNVVVSEKTAKKIFGNKNPIGKQIEYQRKPFIISGVLANASNSSFDFDVIFNEKGNLVWDMGFVDLILLNKNADIKTINNQVEKVLRSRSDYSEASFEFRPLKEFYFSKDLDDNSNLFQFGNKQNLYIIGIIAICVLAISLFNFINIYNVTLIKRGKELGIKKVLGASKRNSIYGFAREIFLLVLFSASLSALFFSILQPLSQNLVGKEIPFRLSDITIYSCIIVTLTFIALIFPAIKYSGLNTIKSIQETSSGKKAVFLRKFLMSSQYVVTIGLLIISLFFIKQLHYMLNKDLGFEHKNIVKVKFFNTLQPSSYSASTMEEMQKIMNELENLKSKQERNQQYIIHEINNSPFLKNLSIGNDPLDVKNSSWKNLNGNAEYQDACISWVTPDFLKLYGLHITEGRFFNPEIDKTRQSKIIINEAAKKFFGIASFDNALLNSQNWDTGNPFQVIGIVKDFNFQHLSNSVQPLIMVQTGDFEENYFMMKITEGKEAESIAFLRELFEEVNPGKEFEFEFVEDHIKSIYREDKKVAKIYSLFTIIAMIISSMGLFSFSIFDVQQRIKEIGIRKINGAKESQIIRLLSSHFITVILLSFLIACPFAIYFVHRYLVNFAFKTNLSIWIFLLAATFTFVISYTTLIWQIWKAATRNPVEALRYE